MMMFVNFIPMLLSGLMKYKRIVFPALMGLAIAGLVYGVCLKCRADGYDQAIEETNAEKLETINENLRIKQKSDNIMRPNDNDYLDWLLSQSN